jgi:hypothetical protein
MGYAAFHDDCTTVTKPTAADLQRLADDGLRALAIFDYAFDSLQPLSPLRALETLRVQGAAKLATLAGIESLTGLREFALTTPPGWDGSGRTIGVDSYRPLESLTSLEELRLIGVSPRELDLSPIMRMRQLQEVNISGVPGFTVEHYARLAAALPDAKGRCLQPYARIDGVGICKKCRGPQVLLIGAPPRARKWICRACDAKILAAHVARWEAIAGAS